MNPAMITSVFQEEVDFETVISMISEAGFGIVSLGVKPNHSGYTTGAGRKRILKLLQRYGMSLDSIHAPSPEGDRLFALDPALHAKAVDGCRMSLEAAADLDGRIVVIHLLLPYDIPNGQERDRMIDRGRRAVAILGEQAERSGVRLALENGQRSDYDEVLIRLLAEFHSDHVGFCYDSGHENVQGACFNLLERFGNRLFTVHLHDNNGEDTHELPYEGTIDWDRFRSIFQRLPYRGNLLLEVHPDHSRFKDRVDFLAQARMRAERLLEPCH